MFRAPGVMVGSEYKRIGRHSFLANGVVKNEQCHSCHSLLLLKWNLALPPAQPAVLARLGVLQRTSIFIRT